MISSVSFASASTGATSFEDRIKQPQAYITKEGTQAAAKIQGKEKKGTGKKILLTAGVLAAIAAGLAFLAKKGGLKINPEGNKNVNSIKEGINKVGSWILEKATNLKDKISKKGAQEVADAAETIAKDAENINKVV